DGDALSFSIAKAPDSGVLTGTPPHLTYTPNTHFTGTDSVTFRVNDGDVFSRTATISINVTPAYYTLTVVGGAGSGVYEEGQIVPISTSIPVGYSFTSWQSNNGGLFQDHNAANTNFTMPMGDTTVTGSISMNTYTIHFNAASQGFISGIASQTVNHGESSVPVTAVAATGFHFTNWSDGSASNPRVFRNVTSNHNVTAIFAINTYTVNFSAGSHGSISGPASQTVNYRDSSAPVAAIPATGYHFTSWSDGSTSNPRVISNVTSNHSVTASFAINTYMVNYSAASHGSISGIASQTINYGSSSSAVTAVPETGYHFISWSDGSTSNPRIVSNVTSNMSFLANFAINTYTVNFSAGSHGSISGTANQTINYGSSSSAVTAVPATGYHFTAWSDGSSSNPRAFSNVTSNHSVTANFAINTYVVNFSAGSHGSISGTASQTIGYGASTSAVTAAPATGYHFTSWSDGSTSNPRVVSNVTSNISLTASFAPSNNTITFSAGSHGSLSGQTTQVVTTGGSTSAVTAIAETNYHFASWSDGNTSNPRVISNVNSSMNLSANFAIDTFTVTFLAGNSNGTIVGEATQEVPYGGSTTPVSYLPPSGYRFLSWIGDGSNNTSNPRTILNVTSNRSFVAQWEQQTYHQIQFKTGTLGTITSGSAEQQVINGTAATPPVVAVTDGWGFSRWDKDISEITESGEIHAIYHAGEDINKTPLYCMESVHRWSGEDSVYIINTDNELIEINHYNIIKIDDNVSKVVGGGDHILYLTMNGILMGQGSSSSGQLGTGQNIFYENPVQIASGVRDIAADKDCSFYITLSNNLYSMGQNGSGQLGRSGTTHLPQLVAQSVAKVSTSGEHSHFINQSGQLYGMGWNHFGAIGDGTNNNAYSPVFIRGGVAEVDHGERHTVFLTTNGELHAMGLNDWGQLGDGTTTARNAPQFMVDNVISITAGSHNSYFIDINNELHGTGFKVFYNTSAVLVPNYVASNVDSVNATIMGSTTFMSDGSQYFTGATFSELPIRLPYIPYGTKVVLEPVEFYPFDHVAVFMSDENFQSTYENHRTHIAVSNGHSFDANSTPFAAAPYGQVHTGWSGQLSDISNDVWINSTYVNQPTFLVQFQTGSLGVIPSTVQRNQVIPQNESVQEPYIIIEDGYSFHSWTQDLALINYDNQVDAIYKINGQATVHMVTFQSGTYPNETIDRVLVPNGFDYSAMLPKATHIPGMSFVSWNQDLSAIYGSTTVHAIYENE
ncbi:MAG: InlB B-repeat-containing protein, partial [Planctomycetes bacterium]|nr:InlB B-repeat-containing protein [Planctomycetota bacterium]